MSDLRRHDISAKAWILGKSPSTARAPWIMTVTIKPRFRTLITAHELKEHGRFEHIRYMNV